MRQCASEVYCLCERVFCRHRQCSMSWWWRREKVERRRCEYLTHCGRSVDGSAFRCDELRTCQQRSGMLAAARCKSRHQTAVAMAEGGSGSRCRNPYLRKFGEALDNVVKCACNWRTRLADSVRITSGERNRVQQRCSARWVFRW
jgi:hypothetical protein